MRKGNWNQWLWRVAPIGVVVGIGVFTDWLALGVRGVKWLDYAWLITGWILGWLLVEANKYAVNIKGVEAFLTEWERAIRNVVTGLVLAILGVWVASSSNSLLAGGLVFGMGMRLWSEYFYSGEWKKWYWIIAREISETEHKIFTAVWGFILLIEWLILVRG